ncbi:zinc-dependent metalloproteinase lipoprotein [uncultured Rikenella sp.]|uniref:zinc-dependent metalloproteinase lipoprotein n=3 Tax=uncultured Rikenella sp. TaxID=368003 RepID=UPI00261E8EC8|nr:zinc-dependent metalloproteinase lipoprotein [uncultured Rikenella sp.]
MKKRLLFALALLPAILVGCQKSSSSSPTPPNPALPEIVAGTIPVVFHVLYENSADPQQYISDAVIQRRLAELNKFYSSTLFTDRNIPGVPSQNVGLTFVAATHDPSGKPLTTPGIHRVVYSGSANMSAENFLYSNSQSQRNQDIFWNPNYYVNIWLFSFLQDPGAANDESEVTGISFLPYCTTTHTLFGLRGNEASAPGESYFHRLPNYMHGIALNNRKFQPEAGIDPEDQYTWISDEGMLTLCHEMGHYLGLHHAFDETRNGCSDPDNASDDGCEDTPKYNRTAYMTDIQPWLTGQSTISELPYHPFERQPCKAGSGLVISTNVMDYYFGYRTQITADQLARINFVMQYSPLIPRPTAATKAIRPEADQLDPNATLPEPILMRCYAPKLSLQP